MRVLFLKGKYSEIAEEYFKSSPNFIKNLNYCLKLRNKILIRNSNNIAKKNIIKLFENFHYSNFEKNFDEDYRTLIREFAANSGIKYKNFYKLVLIPDVLMYLFAKIPSLKIPHFFLGCSSCIKKHKNGIEHGRNLDYFGGNIWASHHEIVVVFPEKGQKYITVSSEGFFSPGITAINESFISISLLSL
jgi:hypothetical protein